MNKKLFFLAMLVCVLAFSMALVSCNDDAKLVGLWVGEDDSVELFKDGTASFEGLGATWKAENKRLRLTVMGQVMAMDYKLSGKKLTLTYEGQTQVYTKR
ncbi:MAG: hypothetical protein LBI06_01210 [Treponema sp.]|jgi:hypothetical protein|nr:hypothetical protein [Treponema sp.]